MSKTREYSVLTAGGVEDLTKLVNVHLQGGWKPKGGPFVFEASVCQAVLRTEKVQKLKDQRLRNGSED
jgi:hypothetical protein